MMLETNTVKIFFKLIGFVHKFDRVKKRTEGRKMSTVESQTNSS